MAISQVQPLLLLLLVSLFVLPALAVKFQKCSTGNQRFIEVKTVVVTPERVKRSGSGSANTRYDNWLYKRGYNVGITITEQVMEDEPVMCVMFAFKFVRGYASLLSQVTG
ncbi:unnamed protein product [Microthlaspi erraticum]|uniref:Uncharacterized protein n=1 Tax=Microthlaspi erraticum TaxID=1685480 RepID=A0A6D2KXD5_9BRAS|nr:unnamed protein product [Microthlaspi erraticum]